MSEKYASKTPRSKTLYERAVKVLPGGVSYGIRYFDPYPFFAARARGSKLYDVDGNEYVDFWLGHTALVLGHSPPTVVSAVKQQLEDGTVFGTSHELEVDLAEQIAKMVPTAEMTRFTNSGTEANMYATRLARAITGRNKIAKFEGGWHGGYDALHVGVKYPFDLQESAGLTTSAVHDTILLPFNDLEGVKEGLRQEHPASIIIEPVLGSGGGIPADTEFLKGLRELCDEKEVLLIFDEVITGFRLSPGGAQQYYHVQPDITVFGKIIGGGFPAGAFSGNKELMQRVDSHLYERPNCSFHGGTFAANPITMTAGLTTLKSLEDGHLLEKLNIAGRQIRERLKRIFKEKTVDVQVTGESSLFNFHFTKEHVKDARVAFKSDRKKLAEYELSLIANGVFLLPTHVGALSAAHSKEDEDRLLLETEKYAHML